MAGCDKRQFVILIAKETSTDSYPGEDKVDQSESEGRDESVALTGSSLPEYCRTVEGFTMSIHVCYDQYGVTKPTDDVDAALP